MYPSLGSKSDSQAGWGMKGWEWNRVCLASGYKGLLLLCSERQLGKKAPEAVMGWWPAMEVGDWGLD